MNVQSRRQVWAVSFLFAAFSAAGCAGTSAAVPPATAAPSGLDDSLAHAYEYEVSPEQAAAAAAAGEQADSGVIRVTGTASRTISPDRVRVAVAVESRMGTAGEASADNARRMSAVLSALRGADFPGLELETFGYQLLPLYRSVERDGIRRQVLDGFRVVNKVRVSSSDVSLAGRIIDAAVAAGANRVEGVFFVARDVETVRQQVLREAVADAIDQARVMARALGRTLGPPLEVTGSAGAEAPGRPQLALQSAARARAETPVEARGQVVQARVSITFAIGEQAEGH
ncbi:MAG: SIMPL domain-containing protein [Gemmatimonadota bacterium]